MRKKQLLFVVVSVFLFAILGASMTCAQPKPIDLKCATFGPDVHPHSIALMDFCKEIEKRTNGRVKINYYGSGTLLSAKALYDGLVTGVTDIAMSLLSYNSGRFPQMEGLSLPLGYRDGAMASKVVNDVYWKFVPKELDDIHLLYLSAHGPGVIFSKKPVRTLGDLKGMKVQSGGFNDKILKALGATPVAFPINAAYEAIGKGTVEGAFLPFEALKGWRLAEVIGYVTNSYLIGNTNTMWTGMNKSKWNSLPKDIQEIFSEVSKEWANRHGKIWYDMDIAGREYAIQLKRQIIELPPDEHGRWVAVVQPLMEEYIATMQTKGFPGKELLDYARECIKKYTK
jgi:TRAP-type C4-dicarboxylate transport system substrate-binding protein